jgi:anti-sigma regulatory factor (Ser/Thr protein kinase)
VAIVSSSDDIRVVEHAGQLSLTAPAASGVLSPIRRWVRGFMHDRGGSPEAIDDVELAASELATNVIRHTASPSISLRLGRAGDAWVLDVADAEGVPPLDGISPPPLSDPTGRGLIVVTSIMDEVRVVELAGGIVVRCVRREPSGVAEGVGDAAINAPSTFGVDRSG